MRQTRPAPLARSASYARRATAARHVRLTVVALAAVLAASCRPAAALDEAGRCAHDKLRAHRMAASAHLRCERAFAAHADERASCLASASDRLRRRLETVDARAREAGFDCPAGAEALGLDGSLSWTTRFAHEHTATASETCMRSTTAAARSLSSAYHRCLSASLRGARTSDDGPGDCLARARTRFDRAWADAAACTGTSEASAASAIVAEIDESFARLRVSCGDGAVGGFEQCDDGNTASGDGCGSACLDESCDRVDGEVRCIACPADSVPTSDFLGCRCDDGYAGEPGSCADIDECMGGSASLCEKDQACVNLEGTWACAIPCTSEAFHAALATCGAPSGAIAFACTNAEIPIPAGDATEPRDVECDDLVIDGAGRGITFSLDPLCYQTVLDPSQCPGGLEEDGTCFCPNVDSGEPFLLLRGDRNVVRDLEVRGFFEGIPVRGVGNLVENVRFERMCDDAFGSVAGGVGNVFRDLDVTDGCDKCSEHGGPMEVTDPDARVPGHYHGILEDVRFDRCVTPVRVAASGRFLLESVTMSAGGGQFACDGPRFSATDERTVIHMRRSLVDGCRRGIRFGAGAEGILTDNRVSSSGLRGLRVAGTARVSVAGTTIEVNGGGESSEAGFGGAAVLGQAELDLGGGSLQIDGESVSSEGDNSLCFNVDPNGLDRDLDNSTATPVSVRQNWWCSLGSPAAQIAGPADFVPELPRAPLRYRPR